MNINWLPAEILIPILEYTACFNQRDGVSFSYGLCDSAQPTRRTKYQRYVRGPLPPDTQKWDATRNIRQVCWAWHEWALKYAVDTVYIRRWKGSERWAELPARRDQYPIYELIDKPSGVAVRRDPSNDLEETGRVLSQYPNFAAKVQRLWFDGFYSADTDRCIFAALRKCPNLVSATIPWTTIRHVSAEDWSALLDSGNTHLESEEKISQDGILGRDRRGTRQCLETLELKAVDLARSQIELSANRADLSPLLDPKVDFGKLKRLKLFGNTTFLPVTDDDLRAIARTAVNLEELHVTALSTVTIEGVIALIKSSRSTLRVLEHSPRGDEGFSHPHPGSISTSEHLCTLLTSCPRLRDLSISMPSMCSELFSNPHICWAGECQVRAGHLCSLPAITQSSPSPTLDMIINNIPTTPTVRPATPPPSTHDFAQKLSEVLSAARGLCATVLPRRLSLELFFAGCVFDPVSSRVHGAFGMPSLITHGAWPAVWEPSCKGPYGSTGLYGKDDVEKIWQCIREAEYVDGVRAGLVSLDESE